MIKYIFKRILMMIPVILGISFIIFAIMSFTPGDPAKLILGEDAPEEDIMEQFLKNLEAQLRNLGLMQ